MQVLLRAAAPVIKISGYYHWLFFGDMVVDSVGQNLELLFPFLLKQAEVNAQGVQSRVLVRKLNHTVQNATT